MTCDKKPDRNPVKRKSIGPPVWTRNPLNTKTSNIQPRQRITRSAVKKTFLLSHTPGNTHLYEYKRTGTETHKFVHAQLCEHTTQIHKIFVTAVRLEWRVARLPPRAPKPIFFSLSFHWTLQVAAIMSGVYKMEDGIAGYGSIHDKPGHGVPVEQFYAKYGA